MVCAERKGLFRRHHQPPGGLILTLYILTTYQGHGVGGPGYPCPTLPLSDDRAREGLTVLQTLASPSGSPATGSPDL